MDNNKGRGGGAITESVSAMELDEEEGEECGDHTLGYLLNKRIMSTDASHFGKNQKNQMNVARYCWGCGKEF